MSYALVSPPSAVGGSGPEAYVEISGLIFDVRTSDGLVTGLERPGVLYYSGGDCTGTPYLPEAMFRREAITIGSAYLPGSPVYNLAGPAVAAETLSFLANGQCTNSAREVPNASPLQDSGMTVPPFMQLPLDIVSK